MLCQHRSTTARQATTLFHLACALAGHIQIETSVVHAALYDHHNKSRRLPREAQESGGEQRHLCYVAMTTSPIHYTLMTILTPPGDIHRSIPAFDVFLPMVW
jgi:hypothetical protein